MELNAKVILNEDGTYEIMLEEGKGSNVFIEATDAEIKQMAKAYGESSKKKREGLKKDVEASKKIGKKAIVKAFLKKAIKKKLAKKDNLRILKETIEAGKKALKTYSRGFSKSDNDATQFWSAVELKMKVADSSSEVFEFIRDWFYDVLSYPVKEDYGGGFATDYTAAPKDYIEDILSGIYRSLTTSKGKLVKVWEQDVEPPYSSRVSMEQLERFEEILPELSFDEEIEFEEGDEDEDYDDRPYHYEVYARFSK